MIGTARDARGVEVWIATAPVDMRKSFDGLAEVVRRFLGHDPLSGSLFVFRNRSHQRLKILWWDGGGLTIYYKRIERGEFRFPRSDEKAVAIDSAALLRLLNRTFANLHHHFAFEEALRVSLGHVLGDAPLEEITLRVFKPVEVRRPWRGKRVAVNQLEGALALGRDR